MRKTLITALQIIVSLSIGAALIWFALSKLSPSDKKDILQSFSTANYWWILLASLMGALSHLFRAHRWKMMIKPMGYNPRLSNTLFAVLVMYFANLALPRAGEVLRCGVMTRYENVPFQKAFGTMVTERAVDVVMLLLAGVVAIGWQYKLLSGYLMDNLQRLMPSVSAGQLSLVFLVVLLFGAALLFVVYKLLKESDWPIVHKLKQIIKGLIDGVRSIEKLERPWLFVFHSFAIWLLYFAMIVVCFDALPETSHLGAKAGVAILFFGSFAIIAVQGGIGAYPLVVQHLLFIYGIAKPVGYAFGWIVWTGQTLMLVLLGLTAAILLPLTNKGKKPNTGESIGNHAIKDLG